MDSSLLIETIASLFHPDLLAYPNIMNKFKHAIVLRYNHGFVGILQLPVHHHLELIWPTCIIFRQARKSNAQCRRAHKMHDQKHAQCWLTCLFICWEIIKIILMEQVILVNENDKEVGSMEKMAAHKAGLLHRAFSVLIFNSRGDLLLQKRADGKYHSAGLWTNTCCSHPRPGETVAEAAQKRLMYEMGIDVQPEFAFKFIYRVKFDAGLTEHELDYVLFGQFDGAPAVNPKEVSEWRYVDLRLAQKDIAAHPEVYSYWFKLIIQHPDFIKAVPTTST
jgi:isopentenyl-diphosphate delta-isomerase